MKELVRRITVLLHDRKRRKAWRKVCSVLACIVVFASTYALILPAITMEKYLACGIPAHQHRDACYELRLVCGQEEGEADGQYTGEDSIDIISDDDYSDTDTDSMDIIEDDDTIRGHVHTDACYERVLVCGKEAHTHSKACYKKRARFAGNEAESDIITPAANGSAGEDVISEDVISEDETSDGFDGAEAVSDEASDFIEEDNNENVIPGEEDLSGEELKSDTPAEETGASDSGEQEGLTETVDEDGGLENITSDPDGNTSEDAVDGNQTVELYFTEDPSEEEQPSITGQDPAAEQTPEVEQTSGTESTSDEKQAPGTESTSDEKQAPGTESTSDEKQAPGTENTSDEKQAPGTENADNNGTSGPAAENTSKENKLPEENGDSDTIPESGQPAGESGVESEAAVPAEAEAFSLTDYLSGDTGLYYIRSESTSGTEGQTGSGSVWNPVESSTVLAPADMVRVYIAYKIPAGVLNESNKTARYMLPAQLILSGSRMEEINTRENQIAVNVQDDSEKAGLLGAEALKGSLRPDEMRSGGSEEPVSAIVKVENLVDKEGKASGQDLVFKFIPSTIEQNSDVYGEDGVLTSKGIAVSGYFTLDYTVEEIMSQAAADGSRYGGEAPENKASENDASDQDAVQAAQTRIVFADKNEKTGRKDISTVLKAAENRTKDGEDAVQAPEAGTEKNEEGISDAERSGEDNPEDVKSETDDSEIEPGVSAEDGQTSEEAAAETAETEGNSEKEAEISAEDGQTSEEAAAETAETEGNSGKEAEVSAEDGNTSEEAVAQSADKSDTESTAKDDDNAADDDQASAGIEMADAGSAGTALDPVLGVPVKMPAQTFEESLRVKTGGQGSGNIVSDFFKNLFNAITGNKDEDSDVALASEAQLTVHVEADEDTFPEGTTMKVKAVKGNDLNAVSDAISETVDSETCGFQAVDITFYSPEGQEIEPLKPVRVTFSSDLISAAAQNGKIGEPVIVHVQDDGSAQTLSSSPAAEESSGDVEDKGKAAGSGSDLGPEKNSVTFETGESSGSGKTDENPEAGGTTSADQNDSNTSGGVTVDSEQAGDGIGSGRAAETENNSEAVEDADTAGKEEIESENTSDEVSFEAEQFSIYVIVYTVDFHWEVNGRQYDFSIPGGGYASFADLVEVLGIAKQDAAAEAGSDNTDTETAALTLGDINISEDSRKFVADVESITFSTPHLVSVSRVDENTTVGAIKESLGLECVYSAELTKEQIEEINGTAVESGDWALISMQPFTSTESLTVTMKTGDLFEIRVTDGQIKKTVITASGETYEITVTYGEDALIPEGARLNVREILPEEDDYSEYYEKAAEFAANEALEEGIYWPVINEERLFDIEIHGDEGKIEPAAPVQVDIRLVGKAAESLSVIHFAKEGPEAVTLQNLEMSADESLHTDDDSSKGENVSDSSDRNNGNTGDPAEKVVSRISFSTESFSVYSVVKVDSGTDLVSGGPWAFVTDIANDPGATTGYSESWGQDYFTIIVNANAMLDKPVKNNNNEEIAFQSEGVHVWTNGTESYVGGDAPQIWNFERVSGSNKYYIYVLRNGQKYYINHHYNQYETTSLSTDWKAEFDVIPNGDGTVCLVSNNTWCLCNSGNGEWGSRDYRFSQDAGIKDQNRAKFRLCKKSDDFDSFAARKVSASTITTNTNYVIYRKFEDAQGNEALYALAHDGTFVRVYDGGDTVYWRETGKNIYWNYQLDGRYPVLFTRDPETNSEIYIHPNHSAGQMLSDTAEGLTLLGKDNGEYATSIECWDQAAYDYAGLHVTVNNNGSASLSTGTRVAGTSDGFLFAVASQMPGATAETVETVDSNSMGIKITMFDYGDPTKEYNAGDKLEEMTDVAGSADYTPHAAHALVRPYLEDGLPSSTTKGAMTGLFTAGGSAVTASRENINHLFIKSYYDENGTFRYRSEDNYAYLPYNPQTKRIIGNDFTVYRQAATPYTSNISLGHTYYHHGHFMPFNEIDMNNNLSRLMNQYGNAYENGIIVGDIPLGDGRTYEDIYGTKGIPNFYTGMKMESGFTQPRGGKLENGDDMIFKFTGDDDMWVYIDGVLVLDIGGIHEPLSGTINFATGEVINPTGSSLAGTRTLRDIFDNVLNDGTTPESVKNKIRSITWDGDTFADYSNHDFKAFYMERGAGASNLDIQFNLKVTLTNEFTVEKEIPEGIDGRFANQTYKFRATYLDKNTEKPLHAGIEHVCSTVVYKDRKDSQGNPVPVDVDENGYFFLKAGEAAVFRMEDESIKYNVKEVDIDSSLITQVDMNGVQTAVTDGTASAGNFTMVGDRTQVFVTNHPKTQNLLITKHLTDNSAPLEDGENPVFEFRVYLETTVNNADGTTQKKLVPYSYGPYYLTKIINDATHYFTLTGVNNAPVDKGTEPVICSTTGRSGSINSIPPEYTIVIPNLVIGTNFYLEERRDNIPQGYEFVKEELREGTYDPSTLIGAGAESDLINRVLARDESDKQVFDPETVGQIKNGSDAESHVYNRKPAVIITVEKAWDPVPEDGTSVTVELHRYKKITKGTISVTLHDNNDAPIEGAVFELYKDGAPAGTQVTTNVNGLANVIGLEPGAYKLVQKSTPAGYSMTGHKTETAVLTVSDNVTTPQILNENLTNTAMVTAGTVTLTVTDSGAGSGTVGAAIEGASFILYKGEEVYNSGYMTDSEGKIVVGNLKAGEYHFVQTGTAAEYNMPNTGRTESFNVLDQPGVSQEFTLSMQNSLKGKGTVFLILNKDSGETISNASFELKSGSTVLETGATKSDGTLTFSKELYEGTYTVHQVNTGSAGNDYSAAQDQNVIILANSDTNQQAGLEFVNSNAKGNVTIEVYKARYDDEYNQVLLTAPFTNLKAGTTYYIRFGVSENNIQNGDRTGITTSFVPGAKPVNVRDFDKSEWTSSGSIRYYTMAFTPRQDNTTYRIAIISSWGFPFASAELVNSNGTPLARVNVQAGGNSMLNAAAEHAFKTTEKTQKSIINTDASPASAPAGYAADSTFVETCTLTAGNNWKYTFDVQDQYDADGNPYYYYIVETACSDPDYWIDSYSGDNLNEAGTITVTNKKIKTGGLTIKKSVTVNNAEVPSEKQTIADGTYTFTIAGPDNYTNSGVITVTNGIADNDIVLEGLAEGSYTITETGSTNINGIALDEPKTVTVAAGSQASANVAAFTNNLSVTSLEIIKVKKGFKNDVLGGAIFRLTKVDANKNIITGEAEWSDTQTVDPTTGKAVFTGLVPGRYMLEEKAAPAGYVLVETPWFITVDPYGTATLEDNNYRMASPAGQENPNSFYIENEPGAELPHTGGSGTKGFYLSGLMLMAVGCGCILMKRRRRF